jgi:3-hydroxyisobutyrate dehydrogenase-like beta-hydroxyacid dehydrogenase
VADTPQVGWIGLGRMGRPMALRVLGAGLPLTVWARNAAQAAALHDAGARTAADPATLARGCDLVCTIVGGSDDVQALLETMLPSARPGTVFVDATTAAPGTAAMGAALASAHRVSLIDAPVTGGVVGAERGTLTAFVGGDAAAIERAGPLLAAFSQHIVPCGGAGSGYRMKLINQTMMAGALLGLADGSRLARAMGLAAPTLAAALSRGTAASTLQGAYLERMMNGGGAVTFTLALLRKDLLLAREEADALGIPAPLLDAAITSVDLAIARHGPAAGAQLLAL